MGESKRGKRLLISILVFAFLFIANYAQYQIAAVPSEVYQSYNLTDTLYSSVMTSPMIPAIFLSVVGGILADRIGLKKVGSIFILIGVAGFFVRMIPGQYGALFGGMLMTGFIATFFNANLSKITSSIYPMDQVSRVIGIFMVGSTAAMAVAYATTSFFPDLRSAFLLTTVVAVILAVLWIFFVRQSDFVLPDAPAGESSSAGEAAKPEKNNGFAACVRSKKIWFLSIALMLLMGASMVISNFQVVYLTTNKGISETAAGTVGTVLMIGAMIGSATLPVMFSKSGHPALFLVVITLISGISTVGIGALPIEGVYVCSFLNGAFRSGAISLMMAMPVYFPEIGPRLAGTAGGFISTLELLGAVLIPTYVVIPICGGNMAAYFYAAAVIFAISAFFLYLAAKDVKFR